MGVDEELMGLHLQPSDHVGKHCQPSELMQEEQTDGSIIITGVRGSAFIPDDDGLSVAWVEHPHHLADGVTQTQVLVRCMKLQRTVRKSHRLALFRIRDIQDCGTKFGKPISIIRNPLPNYDCHSLIVGIDPNTADLLELIATECIAIEAMMG
jgi:hypothetical protein